MMVPAALRQVIGKREFIQSLGTPDRGLASKKVHAVVAGWLDLIVANDDGAAKCSAPVNPTMGDLAELAATWGYEESKADIAGIIRAKARRSEEEFDWYRQRIAKGHKAATRKLLAGDSDQWREIAWEECQRRGWNIPNGSDDFRAFCDMVARAAIDAYAYGLAMYDGRESSFTPSAEIQESLRASKDAARQGEEILTLFDRYSAQRLAEGKKRADTLAQDRKSVELLAEFVGSKRGLRSITVDDIRELRNLLATLPATYRKRKEYAGMSVRAAADHARQTGAMPVNLITVNKHLSAMSALFSWAKREGFADQNPCDGLFYDVDKRKNPRPPFDAKQLNEILHSPLFVGCRGDGKEYQPGSVKVRDSRFWIPLICLFTGARIGEIAQLHVTDLQQDGSHWIMHIRNDERTGQLTKSGQSRIVPIHSKLLAMGFVAFVRQQQERAQLDHNPKLFPELTLNERGQNGRASRFWRTYLERIGVKQGSDGFGAHSFRHGLADQLRLAGLYDHDIALVLGHKQSTVTSGYGRLRQGTVARLIEIIESAQFEGVEVGHLLWKQ
jgi:integrase